MPLRNFVVETLVRLFAFDSRVWQTLIVLMRRPGLLTLHYWRGIRVRYVAPVRLYFFISFFTFLLLSFLSDEPNVRIGTGNPDSTVTVQTFPDDVNSSEEGVTPTREDNVDQWIQEFFQPAIEDPEGTIAYFLKRLPWIYFFIMPIFASVLQLFYRKQEAYYVPHLIFTLHVYAAGFLLYALGKTTGFVSGIEFAPSLAMLGNLCYLYVALRRVYGEGRLRTILKQICLLCVHGISGLIGLGLLLVYTLLVI